MCEFTAKVFSERVRGNRFYKCKQVHKNGFPAFLNFTFKLVPCSHHSFVFGNEASEDEGCGPDTGEPDQCINDPAHDGCVAVEKPAHDIESEDSDTSPYDSTDDGECEGNFINYVHG